MATDVTEHQNLKAYGKKVLLSLGFTEQEIQEEYLRSKTMGKHYT